MIETAEVVELPVADSVEGMAHQFVVMSMFGRVVGTEPGLQTADMVGDVVVAFSIGVFLVSVSCCADGGACNPGVDTPRLCWNLFLKSDWM
jgi:hypothetical protein